MNVFINPDDRRPRAGWRLLLQFVLFFILVFVLVLGKNALVTGSLKFFEALVMGIAGIASIWIAAVLLDKRPVTDYGLAWHSKWRKELCVGLALGAIAMTTIFLIEWTTGWITVSGFGWERTSSLPYYLWIISYLMAMVIIGFYEELIFRGYQILNLVEGFHSSKVNIKTASLLAILISSAVFGLLHAGNPNATFISTLNIFLAGIMLAVPYLVTGSLAISIGVHISWNFVQGGLFGFAVSGTPFRGSIIQIKQKGATYITGGNFGPEAGLLGVFGILFILILFAWYCKNNDTPIAIHPFFNP